MKKTIRSIRSSQLHGQLGEVAYQLTRVQFSQFMPPEAWRPAINAYRCRQCITICVDLAGVDETVIDLLVEPRRVLIRGRRRPPEPDKREQETLQVLAMEIDCGPFEREVVLPLEVESDRATAEQHNGLLWVYLPLRSEG